MAMRLDGLFWVGKHSLYGIDIGIAQGWVKFFTSSRAMGHPTQWGEETIK
jgi:hypothetical protein